LKEPQSAEISAGRSPLDGRHRTHYGLRSASSGEAAAALNAANLTIVMLETPAAIANAEEIATVPGIDVLLIGTNDLVQRG
jgi:2-keto-3-deoxy-L-rhamnonate aldolase RhmA